MKHPVAIQVRKQSWFLGALFLMAFCCLGFVSFRFGELFEGLHVRLPWATQFDVTYGPMAFPLFGIVAATAFILSDILHLKRWVPWLLAAVFGLFIVCEIGVMVAGTCRPI